MTSLVTGASGFLGGRLAQVLCERGEHVRVLARRSSGLGHLEGLPIEVVYGDIEDAKSLAPAVEGVDVVYHCAALSQDWGKWERFVAANVRGVENLLVATREAGAARRFVHVSTTDVYGYPTHACDESYGIHDIGLPYNKSKGMGEKVVWEFHRNSKLPVTVIRPVNMFGPRSKDFVVEIANLLVQRSMMLIDGGRACAGLLYVDNAVDAMIAAAGSPETIGKAYNLRQDSNETWRDYVHALADGLGLPRPWLDIPFRAASLIAAGFDGAFGLLSLDARPLLTRHGTLLLGRDQSYPTTRAQRDFGFRPRIEFQEGLRRTLEWLASPAGRTAVPRKA